MTSDNGKISFDYKYQPFIVDVLDPVRLDPDTQVPRAQLHCVWPCATVRERRATYLW
jgi:hypothetical protein